ncbi:unnamed protein product [Rotaria sordida]|uniref:Uncharacterized protein n=1 Tax=Rotaria sordida TaxID=392033 RepID=A0A813RCK1_9BILA|nr:unnamed protein product [Rotaria sordida]
MATKETTYSWKRNILTTGLSTSSLSTITPVTESNSDTQFRTQITGVKSDQRGATENYHKDQKKSKTYNRRLFFSVFICFLMILF